MLVKERRERIGGASRGRSSRSISSVQVCREITVAQARLYPRRYSLRLQPDLQRGRSPTRCLAWAWRAQYPSPSSLGRRSNCVRHAPDLCTSGTGTILQQQEAREAREREHDTHNAQTRHREKRRDRELSAWCQGAYYLCTRPQFMMRIIPCDLCMADTV